MQLNQQANGTGARTDAVTGRAGVLRRRPENDAGARSRTWSAPRERPNVQSAAPAGAAGAVAPAPADAAAGLDALNDADAPDPWWRRPIRRHPCR